MLTSFYIIIYKCLLILATCYDIFSYLTFHLHAIYKRSYDLLSGKTKRFNEIEYLERCKNELLKIPRHLSIIIGPNDPGKADVLSRIAVYALIMDIECISFYDTRPATQFSLEHMQIPKYVSSKKMHSGHFLWSMPGGMGGHKSSGQLKYKNGLEKSIEVVMVNYADGKPLLANICQDLHAQRHSEDVKELLRDRTKLSNKISAMLAERLNNLPEPELAIVFNKYTCTFGLLPWHTRFTEFHTIMTSRYFDVEAFSKVLYSFSRCQQRFGI